MARIDLSSTELQKVICPHELGEGNGQTMRPEWNVRLPNSFSGFPNKVDYPGQVRGWVRSTFQDTPQQYVVLKVHTFLFKFLLIRESH